MLSDLVANSEAPTKCDEPGFMYYVNDGVYGSFNCLLYDHATVFPQLLEVIPLGCLTFICRNDILVYWKAQDKKNLVYIRVKELEVGGSGLGSKIGKNND